MDGLEFDGLNDLVDGLENAVSKYPDLAEASLKREQRDFKKDMSVRHGVQWISTQEILYEAFDFQQSEETDLIWKQISMQRAARKVRIFIWSIMVMKW